MSSNFMLDPRASLAALAISSPLRSIGPAIVVAVVSQGIDESVVVGFIPVNVINWPRCLSSNPCLPFPDRTWAASNATS